MSRMVEEKQQHQQQLLGMTTPHSRKEKNQKRRSMSHTPSSQDHSASHPLEHSCWSLKSVSDPQRWEEEIDHRTPNKASSGDQRDHWEDPNKRSDRQGEVKTRAQSDQRNSCHNNHSRYQSNSHTTARSSKMEERWRDIAQHSTRLLHTCRSSAAQMRWGRRLEEGMPSQPIVSWQQQGLHTAHVSSLNQPQRSPTHHSTPNSTVQLHSSQTNSPTQERE
jgi:hypothetical protein